MWARHHWNSENSEKHCEYNVNYTYNIHVICTCWQIDIHLIRFSNKFCTQLFNQQQRIKCIKIANVRYGFVLVKTYNCKCTANVSDGHQSKMYEFVWVRSIPFICEKGKRSRALTTNRYRSYAQMTDPFNKIALQKKKKIRSRPPLADIDTSQMRFKDDIIDFDTILLSMNYPHNRVQNTRIHRQYTR